MSTKTYLKSSMAMLLAIFITTMSNAQVTIPQPSPTAKFSQKVGLTDVEIEYSRPGVKGRTVFGDLVPYGKLWRTGANMATKLTFSDDVKLGGEDIPAGTYALFTIPGQSEWTIIINKNPNQGGTGNYKEEEDVARFTAKAHSMPMKVETFTIDLGTVTNTSASISIIWENTIVSFPIEVEIDEQVEASIKSSLTVNPYDYFNAAVYYRDAGKDLDQALEWFDLALEAYEKENRNVFWIYRQKSLLQAKMNDYKGAIATAETSLAKAKEANNADYIKMNEESIAEWKKK